MGKHWYIKPLSGKYYATRVTDGDSVVNIWIPDHFNWEPSHRELKNGWEPSVGRDHVEDSRSLLAAERFCKAMNGGAEHA